MQAVSLSLRRVAGLLLALALTMATSAYGQERYAILVGVSGYPNLSYEDRLNVGAEEDPTKDGPANDVSAIKNALLQRGFDEENILVLADGIANTQLPTRANIIDAFGETRDKLVEGNEDYVFVFLAGHGSQQPAFAIGDESVEPDRLDEIFLPYDVAPWDEQRRIIPNALLDDEIGSLLASLRNRGAFVWMVADTCHSATLTRGGLEPLGEEVKFRTLDLMRNSNAAQSAGSGGPVSSSQERLALVDPVELDEDAGGFVGFSAAQAHQSAPQARLPRNAETQTTRGWFSFALTTVLSEEPEITYDQLSQRILDIYNAEFLSRYVTPYYEGTDRFQGISVFGQTSGASNVQWQVRKDFDGNLLLAAGMLDGIGEGTTLAVYPTASAGDDDLIGYVTVTKTKTTEAVVEQMARPADNSLETKRMPARAWARLVDHKPAFELSVSLGALSEQSEFVEGGLREAASKNQFLSFGSSDQSSDVVLDLYEDRIAFSVTEQGAATQAAGAKVLATLETSFGRSDGERSELREGILEVLGKIYKATLLRRVSEMAPDDEVLDSVGLEMTVCSENSVSCGQLVPRSKSHDAGERKLKPGDVLSLSVKNSEVELVDYTVIHIDSELTLSAISQGRLTKSEDAQVIMKGVITADTSGVEQAVVILVEGRRGEEISDFSFFEDPSSFGLVGGEEERSRGRNLDEKQVAERAKISLFTWETDLQ